ncbi:MAG TPA: pyridoxamine kinase [Methanocorpusculum sp.]|nr:pyridoxamine kinase [Methanocorpusculum sp.]
MTDKRLVTLQDISCFGQCSLTVALPIISACGIETVVVPTAVLSTHTTGFEGFTCHDLAEDIPSIRKHWERMDLHFDAIYTGYLGSKQEVTYVLDIMRSFPSLRIVDPAMADNGVLYPAFDTAYVEEMKKLCGAADIVLPNITEATMMVGMPFKTTYDEAYIKEILNRMHALGAKTVILTGVSYSAKKTGVAVFENEKYCYYEHRLINRSCHGTGDVYASVFVGALLNGKSAFSAAQIAADFTVKCIENTITDKSHWYGVKFETLIPDLIDMVRK